MRGVSGIFANRMLRVGLFVPLAASCLCAQVSVKKVHVLGGKDAVEIEVEASDRITPQTQVLTGPDRLVVDFPNATPGGDLRSQSVYRGQVKDLRIGLFQSKPPVTRLVLDLNSAQNYQVFPGRTVIIKVLGSTPGTVSQVEDYPEPQTRPGLVTTNYITGRERVSVDAPKLDAPVPKPLDVSFRNGMLTIVANKATLSDVLYAVQQRTGAEIGIAAGAEQEKVVVDLGPAPAPEVLAQLLNGSHFNFLILSSVNDPRKLDRVILTPRQEGYVANAPLPPMMPPDDSDDDSSQEPVQPPPAPVQVAPKAQLPPPQMPNPAQLPPTQPEIKNDGDPEQ
ncbi:MAG TPA: AMIN domain-containing protein [Candidatus Solibacter sp.]|nr:AMIN domain-containing protein [Candidatus Solibacter sp.]